MMHIVFSHAGCRRLLKPLNPATSATSMAWRWWMKCQSMYTLFGQTTTAKGWRKGVETNGLIMDIETNEVVASLAADATFSPMV